MKDYLVGCLYAPIAMSTIALLAYLFMYKKNYSTKTLVILYLTIMLISASTGLAVTIVLTNLLNLQTFYLIVLGFATVFFICHLLGLTNDNKKRRLRYYTYIHIINVANKKDAFRISIDQAACDNFLKDYHIDRQ